MLKSSSALSSLPKTRTRYHTCAVPWGFASHMLKYLNHEPLKACTYILF